MSQVLGYYGAISVLI